MRASQLGRNANPDAEDKSQKQRPVSTGQLTMTTIPKPHQQKELEEELEKLKKILNLGYELTVRWIPTNSHRISGEVKGNYILVYLASGSRQLSRAKKSCEAITSKLVKST